MFGCEPPLREATACATLTSCSPCRQQHRPKYYFRSSRSSSSAAAGVARSESRRRCASQRLADFLDNIIARNRRQYILRQTAAPKSRASRSFAARRLAKRRLPFANCGRENLYVRKPRRSENNKGCRIRQPSVPRIGVEPTRLSTLAPETSASTISPSGHLLRCKGNKNSTYANVSPSFFHIAACARICRTVSVQTVRYRFIIGRSDPPSFARPAETDRKKIGIPSTGIPTSVCE